MEGEDARDGFRSLVPGVLRFHPESSVVGLCSTLPGEGTTTMTAGVACALAEALLPVAVIDARHRQPEGLTSLPTAPSRPATHPASLVGPMLERIEIIGSGGLADGSYGRLQRLVADTRPRARVVLIDLEPLKTSSQVLGLADCVNAVYLVVEAERERREVIAHSVRRLQRVGLHVAGVLLNKRIRQIPGFLYRRL